MDTEARLRAALGASAAPARDPGFALAVIRAAEAERYQAASAQSVLRAGGIAAAAAALAAFGLDWAAGNPGAFQNGILSAAGLISLVGLARLMSARANVLLKR
jgi:hypothetical protein